MQSSSKSSLQRCLLIPVCLGLFDEGNVFRECLMRRYTLVERLITSILYVDVELSNIWDGLLLRQTQGLQYRELVGFGIDACKGSI